MAGLRTYLLNPRTASRTGLILSLTIPRCLPRTHRLGPTEPSGRDFRHHDRHGVSHPAIRCQPAEALVTFVSIAADPRTQTMEMLSATERDEMTPTALGDLTRIELDRIAWKFLGPTSRDELMPTGRSTDVWMPTSCTTG